jgi:hypothetical protein
MARGFSGRGLDWLKSALSNVWQKCHTSQIKTLTLTNLRRDSVVL